MGAVYRTITGISAILFGLTGGIQAGSQNYREAAIALGAALLFSVAAIAGPSVNQMIYDRINNGRR